MTPLKTDLLPRPGDAYRACGHPSKEPERLIYFVTRDYDRKRFDYDDLERMSLVRSGDVMTLRFYGDVITEVVIEGRHLFSGYQWLGLHRLPWFWEHPSPAEFTDEKATLISRIAINAIER